MLIVPMASLKIVWLKGWLVVTSKIVRITFFGLVVAQVFVEVLGKWKKRKEKSKREKKARCWNFECVFLNYSYFDCLQRCLAFSAMRLPIHPFPANNIYTLLGVEEGESLVLLVISMGLFLSSNHRSLI